MPLSTRHLTNDSNFEDILNKLEECLSTFQSIGIKIPTNSRFNRVIKAYKTALKNKNEIDWPILSQGLCDSYELASITSYQEIMKHNPTELKELLSGSDFPWEENNSHPRNLQFQLFIAAAISLSGFPIELVEPDIRFNHEGKTYSVAAKRVRSIRRLKERIDDAYSQIEKSEYPGFIAIGLEQIARNQSGIIVARRPDVLWDAGETLTEPLIVQELFKVHREKYRPSVIGYIVSSLLPALIPTEFSVGISHIFSPIATAPSQHPCSDSSLTICNLLRPPVKIL